MCLMSTTRTWKQGVEIHHRCTVWYSFTFHQFTVIEKSSTSPSNSSSLFSCDKWAGIRYPNKPSQNRHQAETATLTLHQNDNRPTAAFTRNYLQASVTSWHSSVEIPVVCSYWNVMEKMEASPALDISTAFRRSQNPCLQSNQSFPTNRSNASSNSDNNNNSNDPASGNDSGTSTRNSSCRSGTQHYKSKTLGHNLTREHKHRNPLDIFEIVKVIGEGSMGRVCLVRKHPQRIGGSARLAVSTGNLQTVDKQANSTLSLPDITWETCFSMPLDNSLLSAIPSLDEDDDNNNFWLFSTPQVSTRSDPTAVSVPCPDDKREKLQEETEPLPIHKASSCASTISTAKNSVQSASSAPKANVLYAMKSIHYEHLRNQTFVEELQNEIAVLRTLDHPNIVRVRETFDWQHQLFVIMEFCSGGDLYTRDPYTEAEAVHILRTILSAVAYMHSKEVYVACCSCYFGGFCVNNFPFLSDKILSISVFIET